MTTVLYDAPADMNRCYGKPPTLASSRYPRNQLIRLLIWSVVELLPPSAFSWMKYRISTSKHEGCEDNLYGELSSTQQHSVSTYPSISMFIFLSHVLLPRFVRIRGFAGLLRRSSRRNDDRGKMGLQQDRMSLCKACRD